MSRDASSTSLSDRLSRPGRRALLGLGTAGLLGLSGCGFQPLYGRTGPAGGAASAELSAIEVALIPDRAGQLMRRALQQRLWIGGQSSPRYTLTAFPTFGIEQEGIRPDGLPTRTRWIVTTNWWLTTNGVPPQPVANGTEQALDAFDLPDNQFFAADAAREAMLARLVDQMAEDIVTRLAVRFRGQDAG
ncbi:LPS assembly lipoprotein LptE [Teichococcus wenyumeiae]|nr:LPS assembly lipoprotein LptE [Pseudoroseomonas wenyumeiae]